MPRSSVALYLMSLERLTTTTRSGNLVRLCAALEQFNHLHFYRNGITIVVLCCKLNGVGHLYTPGNFCELAEISRSDYHKATNATHSEICAALTEVRVA